MVKKLFRICLFLAIIICTTSCAPYKNLSTNRFEKKIKDNTIQLVDVRTPEEYAEGHIPSSLNIDVKDKENFPTSVDKLLDKEKKVAVYCRSGRRSRTAAEQLTQKGFKVYNLNKGILHWKEKGKTIEK